MNREDVAIINVEIPREDFKEVSYTQRTHKVDLSFNISYISIVIANKINDSIENNITSIKRTYNEEEYDSHYVRIKSFPFYNCRESGVGIAVSPEYSSSSKSLIMCWAENKNSDDIVVYKCFLENNINPPTIDDFKDVDFWESKKFFDKDDVDGAVDYISEGIAIYNDFFAMKELEKGKIAKKSLSL